MGRVLGLFVALAVAGCGLDESGLADDGSAPIDAAQPDAPSQPDVAADAPPDAPPPPPIEAGLCDDDSGGCQSPDVPAGWTPVAYAENPQSGCPASSWSTADDDVTGVGVGTAQCSCDCSIAANPNCTTGTIATYYSDTAGCGTSGLGLQFTNGGCITVGGNLHAYYASTAIAPTDGQCTVTATSSGTLASTPVRLCIPDPECTTAACDGVAPAGFAACIVADGDQPCPSGSSFSVKHGIAKSAAASCTPTCGMACTFQGGCTNPQVKMFSSNACANLVDTLKSDGTCVSTNGGTYVASASYTATPSFSGCTASGTTSVQVVPTTPRTVCCKP